VRGKRPFSLTRSSFLSSGVHTAKWTGDNEATWDDLKSSIISIMDFSLFGLPMVGADICGFISDTTEELCARWIATGAFYPFSRNHNAIGQAPQELYLWDSVAEVSRKALGLRYQLLPFMYTLFYEAHTLGEMVTRSLWVNFPSDPATASIDRQFMLGRAVMVSPVLDQGASSVNAYFPAGLWYDLGARSFFTKSSGITLNLVTPLSSVNVHVRGGSILPLQRAAMTSQEGRATPFTLLVALCNEGCASGSLFWDDGEQIEVKSYLSASYSASVNGTVGSVSGSITTSTYSAASALYVEAIVVMNQGAAAKPSAVSLNGASLAGSSVAVSGGTITFSLGTALKITDAFTLSWK
jgi:alpha-glucosidase